MFFARFAIVAAFSAVSVLCQAQDERSFRELLTYKNKVTLEKNKQEKNYYKTRSSKYVLDINGDGKKDFFYTSKVDGKDFIKFFDHRGEEKNSFRFFAQGPWSRVFKLQVRNISDSTKILLLYYYEGISRYLEFLGSARIYFITIDNNDFSTMNMFKGPLVWIESKDRQENYTKRKYEVSLYDFDDDSQREVVVKFGSRSRVFQYQGQGGWAERSQKLRRL